MTVGAVLFFAVPRRSSLGVNPWLAAGQILVSVALMASILLQARGAGLGAAFGGDSSVYRSRRGIEKRLFQFTILLTVLFVIFSVATYLLSRTATS
jgi:preprotein translocase subunit SecG